MSANDSPSQPNELDPNELDPCELNPCELDPNEPDPSELDPFETGHEMRRRLGGRQVRVRRSLPTRIRWDRIRRIRGEIARGTYDTPERLDAAVARLLSRGALGPLEDGFESLGGAA